MNSVHLFRYMTNFINQFFSRKTSLLSIFIVLNSCAVNNKMMIGSEVAEIAFDTSPSIEGNTTDKGIYWAEEGIQFAFAEVA